jgi:hypothetical protein
MDERRTTRRMRVLKSGKIIVAEKAPAILCTVRNVSASGACLQMDNQFGIPDTFAVVIDGVQHPCRVAWRSSVRMGVAFNDYKQAA